MRSLPSRLPAYLLTAAATIAPAGGPARAAPADAPDVVVYADPTIARAMDHIATAFRAATGVPVRVFPMPSSLAVALVRQGARNDVLAIEAGVLAGARQRNLAGDIMVTVGDPVVVAGRSSAAPDVADLSAAVLQLGAGQLATVDPVSADRLDGPALAQRLAFAPGQVSGQPSGPDAAAALLDGGATLALVERADAQLPGLREVAVIPEQVAPSRHYAVAASHNAIAPRLDRFFAYLADPGVAASLGADGWELSR